MWLCHSTKKIHDDISDLVGELQEMQSATNTSTSTAADLLKQGAGITSVAVPSLTSRG